MCRQSARRAALAQLESLPVHKDKGVASFSSTLPRPAADTANGPTQGQRRGTTAPSGNILETYDGRGGRAGQTPLSSLRGKPPHRSLPPAPAALRLMHLSLSQNGRAMTGSERRKGQHCGQELYNREWYRIDFLIPFLPPNKEDPLTSNSKLRKQGLST